MVITPADAVDGMTDGHQVDLTAGQNTVTFTVTAEDSTEKVYTVNINQGVTDDYGWKADQDLDGLIAAENEQPLQHHVQTGHNHLGRRYYSASKIYAYRRIRRDQETPPTISSPLHSYDNDSPRLASGQIKTTSVGRRYATDTKTLRL